MQKFDLLIVGAGMVGLTLALAIRKHSSLTVAIADTSSIEPLNSAPHNRVSAINLASQQIFKQLNVWQGMCEQRLQPYQDMHIWDKAGWGKVEFSIQNTSKKPPCEQLGWIVENTVIRNSLWQAAQADSGIQFFNEAITNLGMGDSEVFASFAQQMPITAKLLIGADGANSWVRQTLGMPITFKDYDHHALVATINCGQGHQNTAWQVFLKEGPLALLPLFDENKASIVWSTVPEEAERLKALSPLEFSKALTAASDGKLGELSLEGDRFVFPLTMRMSQDFIKGRAILIGDAAHTIHPLAGQGVNLGLLDAAALAQTLTQAFQKDQHQWFDPVTLKSFNRWRKADALEMIAAMEFIKQLFTPQQAIPKFIRGMGMSLINQTPLLKNKMVNLALGRKGELPILAQAIIE